MSRIDPEQIETIAKLVAQQVITTVTETVQMENTQPRWLTMEEAVVYAKTSMRKLRNWVDEGYIYGFKRTGKYIVDRESIDKWYNSERINVRSF